MERHTLKGIISHIGAGTPNHCPCMGSGFHTDMCTEQCVKPHLQPARACHSGKQRSPFIWKAFDDIVQVFLYFIIQKVNFCVKSIKTM
ncbi:unnamed protein product [Lupinus luteus]|uniref:Uncharacterized protein n=1 Tax=Lupinus luteus TaxID=3873 RepID=A0AAV1WZH9_LUPLU